MFLKIYYFFEKTFIKNIVCVVLRVEEGINNNIYIDKYDKYVKKLSVFFSPKKAIIVSVNNCQYIDSLKVSMDNAPSDIVPFNDSTICDGAILLNAYNPLFDSYLWYNNSTQPSITVDSKGIYTVAVTTKHCVYRDTINITESANCAANIYIPNTFTPNNDGYNDFFEAYTKNITVISLQIFDRLGEPIYASTNVPIRWNGYFREKPAENGVYIYLFTYKDNITQKVTQIAGDISLIK